MTTTFPESLVPANDAARLRTLHQYDIVNTTPEPIFDDYTAWAAQLFNCPISLISLVDDEYVWFKSVTGAEGIPGLPRVESMCSAAILQDEPVVQSDYKPESCTLIKPDVAQAIGLKFYAGSALQMPDGARVGMLAVIGREFRTLSEKETAVLARLAKLVSQTIELRVKYLRAGQQEEWEAAQAELADNLDENAALARYLTSRNGRIDFDDDDVAQIIERRLDSVAKVLKRRMGQVAG
ncbi:GAF domain-containing protein [Hymenobacter persicinus]|uniref:GAF domain-containing protein n=1 Tax=Hymenobacter persicinus TaxID=2025506 RepID=A0A4Q5LDI5_9BACT|nr:GAF domain-containing protein [Hymenobacter persicinus]RYU81241.1 GAF domain-containing protein [Hymenobacter persicinus]